MAHSCTEFPLIDISVIVWNSEHWLTGFFNSLLGQVYPTAKINLFIRDNGSNDNTLAICWALKNQHEQNFNSFTIHCGDNVGFGKGHNFNFALGNAPYFLVTNVDIEFTSNAIGNAINIALADKDKTASWEFRQSPFEHPKLFNPVNLTTTWSSSACILFNRQAFAMVKGYEERIFMYGEDVELSYRLRDHGYLLKYSPSAVCKHFTYEYAHQLKPLQFFGSTLANVLIRCRYGSPSEIIVGFILFISLWLRPPAIQSAYLGLAKNTLKLFSLAPYFLSTRKKSASYFPFRGWDYEFRRVGAFYQLPNINWEDRLRPLVSIIVRTYKGRLGWLREACASIINQTWSRIELLVIEDGSRDAEAFVTALTASNQLEIVRYTAIDKAGRCVAGNHGLTLASGSYIGFLDDDDLLLPDHVETLVTELESHSTNDLAYAIGISTSTQVISTDPLKYLVTSQKVLYVEPFSRPVLWHHNYIPIQTALFRRSLYEKHGGFDLDLENLEDWNLWTRFATTTNFHFVEKATSIYRVPASRNIDAERRKKLDEYYHVAKSRQKDMSFTITPDELFESFEQFARNNYVIAISHSQIRKIIVGNSLLHPLIWPARIISRIIRKLRR